MTWNDVLAYAAIGALVGMMSGFLGIGGGVLVIPLLVLVRHFTQRMAIGTSLAMLLPPIGIFAVMQYARAGQVNWSAAGIMAVFFAFGAWGGAWIIQQKWISERGMRIAFVVFLLYIAGNMLFRAERRVWAAVSALVLVVIYGAAYLGLHALGRRWEKPMSPAESYRRRMDQALPVDYEI